MDIVLAQYEAGTTDLTRVTLLQQNLVPLEDTLAQAQGEIATGLIQVYRAWAAAGKSAWPTATPVGLRVNRMQGRGRLGSSPPSSELDGGSTSRVAVLLRFNPIHFPNKF